MSGNLKDAFTTEGFLHLKHRFDPDRLAAFEAQIVKLFAMQARKIGEYRDIADGLHRCEVAGEWGNESYAKLTAIVEAMEANDKEALYQTQKFFPSCQNLRELFDQSFMELCAGLIGADPATTLLDGPALFVNRPNTQRLLYKWHSEAHYYPRRRRFVNCWFPIFAGRTRANGAMTVLPKSHRENFPFAEYTGFNKDTEGKKNHFLQFEIPENFLTAFDRYECESERGDVILFERNLVHRSNHNTGSEYGFAIVARIWDPSDDLTLAGNIAATPYGGDVGRANLIVRP
jgi:hypothetical protein